MCSATRLVVEGPTKHYLRFDPHIFVGGDRKPLGLGKSVKFSHYIELKLLKTEH
jgi:hypothetical protein